ncbi:MAG: DUF1232 domain-containing protein [Planctomycetales bacterium]|nr:DUF1232 domain-containing protein [Planctomycetales bacterium]
MPRWLIIVLSVLYILSPLDLVPDVIPVIGWLDDVGALGLIVSALSEPEESSAAEESSAD